MKATFYDQNTQAPLEGSTVDRYHIESLVASTNCSYVYIGKDIDTNERKAIKFIKFIRKNVERIQREVKIMKALNHPNILHLDDDFRYDGYMCIVTDYAENQDLQKFISNRYPNGVPEEISISICKQMMEAVYYLHKLNICHRDIKLDNFLVFNSDPNQLKIVLADFGFSTQFSKEEKGEDFCGTPEFMAPEMYNFIPYDTNVDIWSLGISFYKLLTNELPFKLMTRSPNELKKKIQKGLLNMNILTEKNVSKEVIDLISKMCTVNPNKRITAENALKLDWFNTNQKIIIEENQISSALKTGNSIVFNNLI